MKRPTDAEKSAIKAEARKRFGSERVIQVELGKPFDLLVCIAAVNLESATEYDDARTASPENARSNLLAERVLWPEQTVLEQIRERGETAALDGKLEQEYRRLLGFDGPGEPAAVKLSPMSAPPSLAPPKERAGAVAALRRAHEGVELWVITHPGTRLECILAGPVADVWTAIMHAQGEAMRARAGNLSVVVPFARDLCVWAPRMAPGGDASAALQAHLDEAPGRAMYLLPPLVAMGGAYATARASFL